MATVEAVQTTMDMRTVAYGLNLASAIEASLTNINGMTINVDRVDADVAAETTLFNSQSEILKSDISDLVNTVETLLHDIQSIVLDVEPLDNSLIGDVQSRLSSAVAALPTTAEIDKYQPMELTAIPPSFDGIDISGIAKPVIPQTASEFGVGFADRPVVDLQGIKDEVDALKSDISDLFNNLPASPNSKFYVINPVDAPDLGQNMPDWSGLRGQIQHFIDGLDAMLAIPEQILNGIAYLKGLDVSEYDSTLLKAIQAKILSNLQGSTGLDLSAEEQNWLLLQERRAIATQGAIRKIRNEMGKTGFGLPPAAMGKAISEKLTEHTNVMLDTAREIAFKRAELMQANMHNAIQSGTQLELALIANKLAAIQIGLAVGKAMIEAGQLIYQIQAEQVKNRLQAYQVLAQLLEAQLKAMLAEIELYRGQIDIEKLKVDMNTTLLKQYEMELSTLKTKADLYKMTGELIGTLSGLETAKVQIFKSATDAFLAQMQASEADVKRFEAEIRGETVKVDAFKAEVEGFMGDVAATKSFNDTNSQQLQVLSQKSETIARNAQTTLGLLSGEVERMKAVQYGNDLRYKAQTDSKNLITQTIGEGIQAESARDSLSMKFSAERMQLLHEKLTAFVTLQGLIDKGKIEAYMRPSESWTKVLDAANRATAGIALKTETSKA